MLNGRDKFEGTAIVIATSQKNEVWEGTQHSIISRDCAAETPEGGTNK